MEQAGLFCVCAFWGTAILFSIFTFEAIRATGWVKSDASNFVIIGFFIFMGFVALFSSLI